MGVRYRILYLVKTLVKFRSGLLRLAAGCSSEVLEWFETNTNFQSEVLELPVGWIATVANLPFLPSLIRLDSVVIQAVDSPLGNQHSKIERNEQTQDFANLPTTVERTGSVVEHQDRAMPGFDIERVMPAVDIEPVMIERSISEKYSDQRSDCL